MRYRGFKIKVDLIPSPNVGFRWTARNGTVSLTGAETNANKAEAAAMTAIDEMKR